MRQSVCISTILAISLFDIDIVSYRIDHINDHPASFVDELRKREQVFEIVKAGLLTENGRLACTQKNMTIHVCYPRELCLFEGMSAASMVTATLFGLKINIFLTVQGFTNKCPEPIATQFGMSYLPRHSVSSKASCRISYQLFLFLEV